jgi:hypothetical protein
MSCRQYDEGEKITELLQIEEAWFAIAEVGLVILHLPFPVLPEKEKSGTRRC